MKYLFILIAFLFIATPCFGEEINKNSTKEDAEIILISEQIRAIENEAMYLKERMKVIKYEHADLLKKLEHAKNNLSNNKHLSK